MTRAEILEGMLAACRADIAAWRALCTPNDADLPDDAPRFLAARRDGLGLLERHAGPVDLYWTAALHVDTLPTFLCPARTAAHRAAVHPGSFRAVPVRTVAAWMVRWAGARYATLQRLLAAEQESLACATPTENGLRP